MDPLFWFGSYNRRGDSAPQPLNNPLDGRKAPPDVNRSRCSNGPSPRHVALFACAGAANVKANKGSAPLHVDINYGKGPCLISTSTSYSLKKRDEQRTGDGLFARLRSPRWEYATKKVINKSYYVNFDMILHYIIMLWF